MNLRTITVVVLAVLALAACGGSGGGPCAVLQNGNQLCGSALVAWCSLNQVGVNGPGSPDEDTYQACLSANNWAAHGQGGP